VFSKSSWLSQARGDQLIFSFGAPPGARLGRGIGHKVLPLQGFNGPDLVEEVSAFVGNGAAAVPELCERWAPDHLEDGRFQEGLDGFGAPRRRFAVARGLTAPPIAGTLHSSTPGRAVASREVPAPPIRPQEPSAPPGRPPAALDPGSPPRVRRYRPPGVGDGSPPGDRSPLRAAVLALDIGACVPLQ
jgi:hypothetical protein